MAPTLQQPAERIGQCTVEPLLGGISIAGLATLNNPKHEAMELIDFVCAQGCGTALRGPRFFAPLTSCDACRDKAIKADKLEKARIYWEAICPESIRETSKDHAAFPRVQYDATLDYVGTESLLFFGPSGKGKTRLAMLLAKRCLVRFGMHVNVLWPEQLKAVKGQREILQWVHQWGKYELLVMDDALLTGAQDERITDALKDLMDYRMRHKRHQIITSQIGGDEYRDQANKFENVTAADLKRIDALLRRIKETARLVSFAEAVPTKGEETF